MAKIPQVLLTLSPEGRLIAELPSNSGSRHKVEIAIAHAGETLLHILHAQFHEKQDIGSDGAPTQAQVRHNERHQVFSDSRCRFCIAEGQAIGVSKRKPMTIIRADQDGIVIRKIKQGVSQMHLQSESKKSIEDIGL